MRFVFVALALAGCAHLEAHCKRVAVARHGEAGCEGVLYTWTEGERCFARLQNQTMIYEGRLRSN